MATLQQTIAEKFLSALAAGKDVDAEKIKRLRELLAQDKRPKADDFVAIFSGSTGGDIT